MTKRNPFRYFKTSPEIIRLAVMLCVRFPLSLRNVEDLMHEREIDGIQSGFSASIRINMEMARFSRIASLVYSPCRYCPLAGPFGAPEPFAPP